MKFKPFFSRLQGKTLTLSAEQRGKTAEPVTQADYGILIPSAGGVVITLDRTRIQCAPDSVRFGVDLSGADFDTPGPKPGEVFDRRLHELIFLWNTGDAGRWSAPQNVLPKWNDKSRAKGPWFAHCYTKPGRYTVHLTVIEPASGKIATDSVKIDVTDPDTAYSGEKTICINPPGMNPTGWGPSDALYFEWDPRRELINDQPWWRSINFSSDRRFLFNPAATYSDKVGFRFDHTVKIYNPYIGSAGPERTVLNTTQDSTTARRLIYVEHNYNNNSPTMDFRIDKIDGRGTFDPSVEVTQDQSAEGKESGFIRANKYLDLVVSDCRMTGFKNTAIMPYGVSGNTTNEPTYTHIDDTRVTDMGGQYGGVFLPPMDMLKDSALTLSGTALVQNPNAISAGGQHRAPLRENGQHKVNLRCCECFGQDTANSGLKLCTTPSVEIGHIVNLDGVMSEATYMPLHFQQNATQGIGRSAAINAIADGLVIVADYSSHRLIESNATGVTLRNVLGIVPDSPLFHNNYAPGWDMNDEESASPKVVYTSRRLQGAVGFLISGTPSATTLAARCAVYNSTFVASRSAADNSGGYPEATILFTEGLTNTVAANNLLHGPWLENSANPEPFGKLSTDTLWEPYSLGFKGYRSKSFMTEFAMPPDAVISAAPLAGSPALGAALSGETAYFDITGKVRPLYPSIGAWELG